MENNNTQNASLQHLFVLQISLELYCSMWYKQSNIILADNNDLQKNAAQAVL